MEEIKKEIFELPLNYPFDLKNDLYEEMHIKEMKEEFSDLDDGNEVKLLVGQEIPAVDVLKECLVKEDSEDISLKEEVSEEFLHTEMNFSVTSDAMCAKFKNSLPNTASKTLPQDLQEKDSEEISVKEEVSEEFFHREMNFSVSSDVLCAKFKNSLPNTASETLPQDLQEKDSEEISFKEEVSKEFLHTDMNFSVTSHVLCTKFKNSLPNIASEVFQQDLQEKEGKFISSTDPKIILISCGIKKTAAKPVNHEETWLTDANLKSITHAANKLFKCDLCPYQGTTKKLKRHKFTHAGKKPLKCDLCPYQAVKKEDINRHSIIHTGRKPFKCDLCPYQATRKEYVKQHALTHKDQKPFKCDLCPYQAVRKGDIKRHSIIHTGRKSFKCDLCPYQAKRKDNVKQHARIHTDHKPFKCDLCPYQTARKGYFKEHSIIHRGRKSFKCPLCPYQAVGKESLKRHSIIHTDRKSFKCELCPYQATRKDYVKQHVLTHSDQKPFKCDLCSYQTTRKTDFKRHALTHTDQKPFKCDLCPYQAARKEYIKQHSIIHTGRKPFKCDLCPYQAAKKDYLKAHVLTHTD